VNKAFEKGGVLITTYQSIRTCKHLLLTREWGYVILDEGHKIKSSEEHHTRAECV
jgi:DNA excision repair protein ERCC-6